jgi:hypothetical protein
VHRSTPCERSTTHDHRISLRPLRRATNARRRRSPRPR